MSQKAHVFLRGVDKGETDIGEKEVSPSPELHRKQFGHRHALDGRVGADSPG